MYSPTYIFPSFLSAPDLQQLQKFLTSQITKNNNKDTIKFNVSEVEQFLSQQEQQLADAVASIETSNSTTQCDNINTPIPTESLPSTPAETDTDSSLLSKYWKRVNINSKQFPLCILSTTNWKCTSSHRSQAIGNGLLDEWHLLWEQKPSCCITNIRTNGKVFENMSKLMIVTATFYWLNLSTNYLLKILNYSSFFVSHFQ